MTPSSTIQQKLASLPEPIQDYLYSEQAGELNEKIITRNKLTEDQESLLFALLRELYVKDVPLPGLADEVKKRFNFDEAKAKQLAIDIAGYRLLPLDKWLGDVDGYLRSLGADPKAYPADRVPIEHRTLDQAAEDIVKESELPSSDTHVQSRLRDVAESFLAGIRTEEQTKDVLTRPEKIGGLGLAPTDAGRMLDEMKEEVRSVIIDRAPVPAPVTPAPPSTSEGIPTPPVEKPAYDFATIVPEDEEEITKIKKAALPARGADKAEDTSKRIVASVEEIYRASGLQTEDEASEKRIKTVIGNRLRDVRDPMETLETMVQPKELGGLGMSQDAARALLNVIQSKLTQVHETHAAQVRNEKSEWVEQERLRKIDGDAKERSDQKSELEKLYQGIVSKSKKAMKQVPAAPVPGPKGVSVSAPPNLPITEANPVPPPYRAPEPPVRSTTAASSPLSIVRPSPSTPVAPVVLRRPGEEGKPKMQDIKSAARLTGPVEELKSITIVDFRRLSKDPKEACLKIKDKIDLLANQSYTHRTEGIAAWGASEVVRTYLELMREGLNGTPISDAVAARQAAKKPYLTPEEFRAVADLSRQLRY